MSEQQFKIFWAILDESESNYEPLKEELKKAFLTSVPKVSSTHSKNQIKDKSHKLCGYNVFMSETMKEGRKEGKTMGESVQVCKDVSEQEKSK